MAGKSRYNKSKPVQLRDQLWDILQKYPSFKCTWTNNMLVCIGTLKPDELCRTYTVKITYSLESPPRVLVLDPQLEKRNGEAIPHLYGDGHLCLYYPKNREFTRYDLISETVIPWTSLWLFYYEIWLATGKWEGSGIDHTPPHRPAQINDKGET